MHMDTKIQKTKGYFVIFIRFYYNIRKELELGMINHL